MLGIAFRLFAFWCIVEIIFIVPRLLPFLIRNENSGDFSETDFYLLSSISMGVGVLLVLVIFKLGKSATKSASSMHINNEHNPELEKFLLQLLGVYFVLSMLPTAPGTIAQLIIEFNQTGLIVENFAWLTGYVFQLILGMYLIAKPKVWSIYLNKLRVLGQ